MEWWVCSVQESAKDGRGMEDGRTQPAADGQCEADSLVPSDSSTAGDSHIVPPSPTRLPDCPPHPRPPCSVPRAHSHACRSLRSGTPRTISHPFPGECYLNCQLAGPGVGPCCCLCVCQPWPTVGIHWSGKVDRVSHDLETVLGSFIPSSSRVIQDHLGVVCLLHELCLTLFQGNKID